MNRNLEQAFAEQAGQLFTKCRAYIGIDEAMPTEAKAALKEEITAAWEALDVDFNRLFEEIADNLEEPMSEQQRERYCFKLLTPFKEFSSVLYPYGEIGQDREYLETVQGVSDYEERVKRIEKQIAAAQTRADRWFDKCFGADGIKATDEVEAVCFELAQLIKGYGIVLDAAFVVNGIDLKRMQERCGVWIISFPRLCRAWEIGEFIGSEALALGYVNKLPQEQQEQQKDLHYYCEKAIEKGYLVKADGGYRLGTWRKAQLAYFLKHFPNTDGTFPDKEYCVMFGESRLSKAADQLSINKNGDGKPRGYEIVDKLLEG